MTEETQQLGPNMSRVVAWLFLVPSAIAFVSVIFLSIFPLDADPHLVAISKVLLALSVYIAGLAPIGYGLWHNRRWALRQTPPHSNRRYE